MVATIATHGVRRRGNTRVSTAGSRIEASDGGFGAFLLFNHDWAPPAAKLRSYELFAQYVIPYFTGHLTPPRASQEWVTASGREFVDRAAHAIGKAIEDHAAEQQAKHSPAAP